jgi:7-cyano-7-deazaguanine synthase
MKAVVIFSGGQDSTTCLGWAKNRYAEVVALSFFYGQKHAVELRQGEIIAEKLGVERHVIQADFFGSLVDSALTHNGDVNAPHGRLSHLPASYVPNRNGFFLLLAHAFAQKIGPGVLVAGMCQTDYSGYADCRAIFVRYMQSCLNIGVYGHDLTPEWVAGLIEGEASFSRGNYPTKDGKKFYRRSQSNRLIWGYWSS